MKNVEFISKIAILTALAISLGYVLSFIPNLELITTTIFLAGFILGSKGGILVGLLSFLIFGFANPFGTSPLPLLIAQISGGMIIGFMGGIYGKMDNKSIYRIILLGISVTFIYDILTTLTGFIFFPTVKTFTAYLIAGAPFIIWHIVTQGFIYGAILHPIIIRLNLRRY